MQTILIKGLDLTTQQINMLPKFNGLKRDLKSFLECNSFYFSKDGKEYTTNELEYYPVCTSFKNLKY